MLILPLHRVPGRRTIAWCTFVLMLLNLFIHLVLQAGDARIREDAVAHYRDSGLGTTEAPLYGRYLQDRGDRAAGAWLASVTQLPEPDRSVVLSQRIDLDPAFLAWAGREGFDSASDREDWHVARREYEAVRARSFTDRFMLRGNQIDPVRMFTAAFLHADLGHLLGNLVFLFVVGHLVEAALGAWRYLLLYAVAAVGASLAALAWRWGEPSAGLGASGAIAGLMGAYCVLWGRRKVRFFYWFFVYFDYVRAPAIWLLPAWLGWEVLQMLLWRDAGIGFEAHAGGLVTGALVALAFKRVGSGIDESRLALAEDIEAAGPGPQLEAALQAVGRMELDVAELRLGTVLAAHPACLPARIAHYRVARYAGNHALARSRAEHALSIPTTRGDELQDLADLARDAIGCGLVPAPDALAGLASRLVDAGERTTARSLLEAAGAGGGHGSVLAMAWLRLALAEERAGDAGYRTALELIVQRFPGSEQAGKARFLLDQA